MGKRTKDKTDEELERKIRRLQKEIKSRRHSSPPIVVQNEGPDWDSFDASSYNYRDEVDLDVYCVDNLASEEEENLPEVVVTTADIHACHDAPSPDKNTADDPIPTNGKSDEQAIPDEIMEILGVAKKSEETFGKKIPQGVSERLGKILIEGLAKEQKEILLTKTLIIPENFQLAKAPKLNAEVSSVLTDPARNRDKRLEKLQNQLGSAIAGLVNLTTELINEDLDKMVIIKRVSEVNQVLLDLHHEETVGRRRLIVPMLDKNFINIIQNIKRDQFLFGDNLGDNIKTSKSIERSSLQIKKPAPPHLSMSRKPFSQTGNVRAPVRGASGPGPARAQPSAARYYPQPPPPASRRPPTAPARQPPQPPPARGHLQDYRSRRR